MSEYAKRVKQEELAFESPVIESKTVDFSFLRPLVPTVVFAAYWRFAAERQRIFFRRMRGDAAPWTRDSVLQAYKFTNAYRASDRVSQYLIRHVIAEGDQSPEELFFRIILFKVFNRISTWELLRGSLGEIEFRKFRIRDYDRVLSDAFGQGRRLYSAAYIMPSGGARSGFARKHQMHLSLIERMMNDKLPNLIAGGKKMSHCFSALRAYPTIGDFLAYQYITDLNYSDVTNFSEMEFVVAGPGAKDGMQKCFTSFGGLTEAEVIRFVADRQEECFQSVGEEFLTLGGRRLQLIDCQNLFCEVDKYARVKHPEFTGKTGRSRIKQKLIPSNQVLEVTYPNKWGINQNIKTEVDRVPHVRR